MQRVGGLTEKGKEETVGDNKSILYIDWSDGYMVSTFVKTHQTDYLKFSIVLCKLLLSKVDLKA